MADTLEKKALEFAEKRRRDIKWIVQPEDAVALIHDADFTGFLAGAKSCAAGPWVSVKERLPEKGQHILSFHIGHSTLFSGANILTYKGNDTWTDGEAWHITPTHWAPITEPGGE